LRSAGEQPSITVALATYNGERHIRKALDSIVGQTLPAAEVLVLDDGSTDATADIVRGFGSAVRLVQQANTGVARAFNRLFEMAEGDFVALAADDDIWLPDKLQNQAGVLAAHPEVDVVFSHAEYFGDRSGPHSTPSQDGLQDSRLLRMSLFEKTVICAPSAVIRRSLHERLGGFRDDLPAEDYEFWFRALRGDATFYFDPRLAVRYRRHARNQSGNLGPLREMVLEVHRTYGADVGDRAFVRHHLARDLRALAGQALAQGRTHDARRAYLGALRHRIELRPAVAAAVLTVPGGHRLLRRLAADVPPLVVER
jgi:glycosyltransferase involved in cell wall biosynthesis